ncbi:MAG: creatininase family protein [Pyrodictiaceae archaeon]
MVLDTLIALEVACRVARHCHVLVAWPLGYGYSPTHRRWAGFDNSLLQEVVKSIVGTLLERIGYERVLVLDAHYGHKDIVLKAIRGYGDRVVYFNFWDKAISMGYRSLTQQLSLEELLYYCLSGGLRRGCGKGSAGGSELALRG